jgi:short-subunit dehydrogenase
MKHIVITGSTRGIGYGLVDAFLDLECSVTISGRSQENVDLAASKLVKHHSLESVLGIACDVRNPDQVQTLWRGMLAQGYGAIYNMEGMGSDGRMHTGLTYYGTSNAGRNYFNSSLIKETEGTPLIIGTLRPGMVVTDLLTKQYEDRPEDWEKDKRIFNILADRVETVCPWLAEQMLNNDQHGAKISWTSRWKIMGRFLTSPFSKRNVFEEPTS